MVSRLEKALKDPESMKAKILKAARRVFGEYGFHGATTRMIAKAADIDVSTLFYHWGDKADLYEAVVCEVNKDLKRKFVEIEDFIHNLPLAKRMEMAMDRIIDYLFENPEISKVILSRYFVKITREEIDNNNDNDIPEYVSNIAYSMGLTKDRKKVPSVLKMQVMTIVNGVFTFMAGQETIRESLGVRQEAYIALVKDTIKFMMIPPFVDRLSTRQSK
ncbi:MAG: TetR/AcrR family transcriptional regulator [Thermodesulfobacteriota bacterium]|nr:TetR/AcrR family transcriptional regulator [Thermodesulfobacteriota bacterium]